ncbi:hypothetical protein MSP8886_00371 [Marinomonas spartinae]|uniref:Phytase-like domain-containing protein n=1 Tax=Marinomonas spartinae TaxID=1792290 RepID=A0A1A8T307_9GAMM|nr:esterase-like activity of phytase family protein [Marinomonas spartinae]SBS25732.1 hypothetical protein MSP8886_00371 [Marinomonas spartinae]
MKQSYIAACLLLGCMSLTAEAASNTDSVLDDNSANFPITRLDYIGEYIIPNDTKFDHVLVGGLSGIDYSADRKQWLMISDDRASKGPARAYLGNMSITEDKVGPMTLTKMISLYQPNDTLYPSKKVYEKNHKGVVPDFESIRFNPFTMGFRYTSEGDRSLGMNPFIRDAYMDGHYLEKLPIPQAYRYDPHNSKVGFRDNLALEGSSFTPNGKMYFAAMEAPLKQDGSLPSLTKGAYSRVIRYDELGDVIGEYVYPIDPLPAKPGPGKHADNGVSEILALNSQQLLVVERSGIQDAAGHYHDYIRIYQADIDNATNVIGAKTLVPGQYQPMKKHLLLNLNDDKHLPKLDNIEGITFGPKLANGQRTLVLISDNNFNASEVTQLLAFKVVYKKD